MGAFTVVDIYRSAGTPQHGFTSAGGASRLRRQLKTRSRQVGIEASSRLLETARERFPCFQDVGLNQIAANISDYSVCTSSLFQERP